MAKRKKPPLRTGLEVQTIHLIHEPEFQAVEGLAKFKNTGGMVTFISIMNKGDEPTAVKFPSLTGKRDIEMIIPPERVLNFGPFATTHFNRPDDCVWLDVEKPIMVAVQRLGV